MGNMKTGCWLMCLVPFIFILGCDASGSFDSRMIQMAFLQARQNDLLAQMVSVTDENTLHASIIEGAQHGLDSLETQVHQHTAVVLNQTELILDLEAFYRGVSFDLADVREQLEQRLYDSGTVATNCADFKEAGGGSRVETIYPDIVTPLSVYCDEDTEEGGWTVFQRRRDGSEDFYRTWDEYEAGFGQLDGDFWLGLSHLAAMTSRQRYELRVDVVDWDGQEASATFSNFTVGDRSTRYRLGFNNFTGGPAGDALRWHNGQAFSTWDADHDGGDGSCAVLFHGAWWYYNHYGCLDSNLNGRYQPRDTLGPDGVTWSSAFSASRLLNWKSLRSSEMKMRPQV